MQKELGLVIRECRNYRGLKQEYMAYKLGVTLHTYANIENGRVDSSCKKLRTIAGVLNIKARDIFTLAEDLHDYKNASWITDLTRQKIKLYFNNRPFLLTPRPLLKETDWSNL
ncbi:MAG TPA: helix-turn-helix domain-containing protein [Sphingobacteriaceae bacterium]|nr:helix-turn-helix domain-containing protein [Sphingobacteriaceae bacterium]